MIKFILRNAHCNLKLILTQNCLLRLSSTVIVHNHMYRKDSLNVFSNLREF